MNDATTDAAAYGMTGAPAVAGLILLIVIVVAVVWWNKRKVREIGSEIAADTKRAASRIDAKLNKKK